MEKYKYIFIDKLNRMVCIISVNKFINSKYFYIQPFCYCTMSFNNTSYSNSFLPNQRYQTDGLRSDYQKSCQPREYITSYNSINSLASSKI